jgi:hypothetical protein
MCSFIAGFSRFAKRERILNQGQEPYKIVEGDASDFWMRVMPHQQLTGRSTTGDKARAILDAIAVSNDF